MYLKKVSVLNLVLDTKLLLVLAPPMAGMRQEAALHVLKAAAGTMHGTMHALSSGPAEKIPVYDGLF